MLHYCQGQVRKIQDTTYIISNHTGIQVAYAGQQSQGEFFLFPYLDDNRKTIVYYAFDTYEQYHMFAHLMKISGIGPKTAFHIAQLPQQAMQEAIQQLDVKFFQSIPGIGPKSAKKILLELKDTVGQQDLQKLTIDDKLLKKITQTMKGLGYESSKVKKLLLEYPYTIAEDTLSDVMKRLLQKL